ncbi:hypothetical protein GCM10010185_23700 [Saccharothrix coeruleofusca]|uniref:Uncharacterized protein n=1 Tax=Saccharothrix coeruleofusca TaxID=33919 RepID=A0A918AJN3_9PSEU|nr:hypothetical protein GCM10010185_23700 [Saccharothrix coeruleofusca]
MGPPHTGPAHTTPPQAGPSHAGPPNQRGPQGPGPRPNNPAPPPRPRGADGPSVPPPRPHPHGPTPHDRGGAPGVPHRDPNTTPPPRRPDGVPQQYRDPYDAPPPRHTPDGPPAPRRAPDAGPPHRNEPDAAPPAHRDADAPTPRRDPDSDPTPHSDTPHSDTPHHDADRPSIDEAHARHGETTPAGISHHRGDGDMGDLPQRVPHDPRYFTADVHITPDGRARIGNHTYSPEEYGDLLRRNGWDGRTPIRLIGCDAGSNDFANRLSRHTNADVLAPTKPAWTDSNGRVYTSDAEIGPDGTRRPKIPPNGEWETHRPDGTRTKAGEDGFVPGTHDKDKSDLDPSDARDRGKGDDSWRREVGEKSGLTPEQKLRDNDYMRKHFHLRKTGDRWELVINPSKSVDIDGKSVKSVDVPPGWRPPDGHNIRAVDFSELDVKFKDDRPPALPAEFHGPLRDHRGQVDPALVQQNQDLIDRRRQAIEEARQAPDGTPEYKEAQHRASQLGEQLGERGGEQFMDDHYPGATRVDPGLGGGNRFDMVHRLDDGRFVILECKGPYATRDAAWSLDGNWVEQGHPDYFEKKIHDMLNAKLSRAGEANMRKDLAAEGKTPDQIDQAIADHKTKLEQEREMARQLDEARRPQALAAHVRENFGISEAEIDRHLRETGDDRVKRMTDAEFQDYKAKVGYDKFYQHKVEELRSPQRGAAPDTEPKSPQELAADQQQADRLEHLRRHGLVEYHLVTAKTTGSGANEQYNGYVSDEFIMDWQQSAKV